MAKKVSTKLTGVAASMPGATAAKGLTGGKVDPISKKKSTGKKGGGGAPAATPAAPAVDTSGAGQKEILLQFKTAQFFANASRIQGFNDLKINSSCETEDKEDTGDKYVSLKNKKGFEVSFKAYLDRRLGVDDVRAAALSLARYAAAGETGYIYCCGEKLVPSNMMATSGKIADVRMTPAGIWISCEVQMTFKSCGKLEGADAGGGGEEVAGGDGKRTFTATVSYSASSGSTSTVSATSTVSYDDALKKAYAKVPKNAQWAHEDKDKASNQQKINTAAQQQSTAKSKSAETTNSGSGLFARMGQILANKKTKP